MEQNIPRGAIILAVNPQYSLPRFPQGRDIRHGTLWSDSGRETTIIDSNPDYIVIGMSLPRRLERKSKIEAFFSERGYEPVASFKAETPLGGADIVDLHAVNQHIVIFRRSLSSSTSTRAVPPVLGAKPLASLALDRLARSEFFPR